MTAVIIRAVLERRDWVEYLRRHLPDAETVWDRYRSSQETFERALTLAGNDPVVLIEDDVILTENFRDKLEAVIAHRRSSVVQFFSRQKADLEKGSRWAYWFQMNQCTYYPAGMAAQIADYMPGWKERTGRTGNDSLVNDFLRERNLGHWIHVPNLVEHREGRSAINPRRATKRQSLTFAEPAP